MMVYKIVYIAQILPYIHKLYTENNKIIQSGLPHKQRKALISRAFRCTKLMLWYGGGEPYREKVTINIKSYRHNNKLYKKI